MLVQDEEDAHGSEDAGDTALRAREPSEQGMRASDEVMGEQTKPQQGLATNSGWVTDLGSRYHQVNRGAANLDYLNVIVSGLESMTVWPLVPIA